MPSSENSQINVIRNGIEQQLQTSELLVGDIIYLKGGDQLDVDAIIIGGDFAEIDQSQLTGLSETIMKKPLQNLKEDNYNIDPFLSSGSTLLSGNVIALVLCVGINCQIGQLKHKIQENELKNSTILDQNLGNVAKLMVGIGVVMATVMFISLMIYFFMSLHEVEEELFTVAKLPILLDMFMESFLVIVLSVPEGLPMVLTLSLAFTVKKLQPSGIITRKLNVCYAMGGCNELLIDKTGTLTDNTLTIGQIYFFESFFKGSKNIFTYEYNDEQLNLLKEIIQGMMIVSYQDDQQIKQNLNISSYNVDEMIKNVALQFNLEKFANSIIINPKDILQAYPYNTNTKYSAKAYKLSNETIRIYFKGNPQILLEKSKWIKIKVGQINKLSEKQKTDLLEQNNQKLKQIALSFIDIPAYENIENISTYFNNLTLISIFGFQEKLRDQVPEILSQLSLAGINVRIVTGDTKETALQICQEIGFDLESSEFLAIDGKSFQEQIELNINKQRLLKKIKVLYCASSSDKQLLTDELIKQGNIVGYMGDGINDTQALQHCDIGLSFNQASSIAQQSASIIFCNANPFSKLLLTISYGKNIYENIQRFINLQLTFYIVSIFLIVYSSIKIGESPLSIVQIIWLSLVQDVFSSIAIATEIPTDVAWLRQGFKRNEYVISQYIFKMIFLQVSYQICALVLLINSFNWSSPEENIESHVEGWDEEKGIPNTIIFMAIAWMQLITLICSRRIQKDEFNIFSSIFSNKNFMTILALILGVLFTMALFGGKFVQCSRLTFYQHLECFSFGLGSFLCFFIAKIFISVQENIFVKLKAKIPFFNQEKDIDQEEKLKFC